MPLQLDHDLKKRKINATDANKIKMGGLTDYLEISKTDGTPRLRGTGIVWRDMIMNLFGSKLESEAGKVTYDYDDNIIVFASGGSISTSADRVGGNQEINHEFKVGDSLTFKPHLHWFQVMTNETLVVDEDWTAPVVGLSVDLDFIPANGTVVVQDATDTTTYVEDTDYEVDYVTGAVTNLTLTPAATYHIDYGYIAGVGTTPAFIVTARYRVQRNGYEKVTNWTEITCEVGAGGDDIFDFTALYSGTYNQISAFDDIEIDCGISDTIQIQIARTDSESGDMSVTFFDLHGEIDSLGSEAEFTKAT
ncbi:MAG: hypothetical protein JRC93_10450 [Deltaproteobacteria bacterium]|nr:hypothetical protein [Deltaproteobacteria bacterium]